MTGLHLAQYRIDAELGRGGMGIVYRATDTKLNRTVALKVLPAAALSSDDDRARFVREAQSAAQLHHPNIATVFGIDEAVPVELGKDPQPGTETRLFIAMEYIEGETVREVVEKGPLKLQDAVNVAGQVAEALKEAHAKEIVHRDVKSANVMLTQAGVAKVLDFGLAKTNQSTMLTRMGSTLGTVAYMSPEQARGQEVDGRTDLYSLGTMLYEMVAGKLPFAGDYEQAVLYGIMNEPPEPLTAVRTGVPMQLEWIVSKLLSKEAEYRYQTAGDLLADLKTLDLSGSGTSRRSMTSVGSTQQVSAVTEAPAKSTTVRPAAVAAAALLIGALGAWFAKPTPAVEPGPNIHAQIDLGADIEGLAGVTVSPSGRLLAWSHEFQEVRIRNLESGEQWSIPESDRTISMQFSPDETWLLLSRSGRIDRVQVRGGRPIGVVQLRSNYGSGQWTPDDAIIYENGDAVYTQALTGGEPRVIVPRDSVRGYDDPVLTPDGRYLIALEYDRGAEQRGFAVFTYPDGDRLGLLELRGIEPRYLEPGYLVYQPEEGGLMAVALDLDPPRLLGAPVPIFEQGTPNQFSLTDHGHLFLARRWGQGVGDERVFRRMLWDGTVDATAAAVSSYDNFAIAPSGALRAVVEEAAEDGGESLFIVDLESGVSNRLTYGDVGDNPWWHPSGDSVLYVDRSGTASKLVLRAADGSGVPRILYEEEGIRYAYPSATAAFDRIVFGRLAEADMDIWMLDLSTGTAVPLVEEESDQGQPRISPDGRFVVYEGDQVSGEYRIYMEPTDVDGSRWDLSRGPGFDPYWSPDGRTVFFEGMGPGLIGVDVDTSGGRISISNPRPVLDVALRDFAPLPDGSGVVITTSPGSASTVDAIDVRYVDVILNWTDELRRLVPR